MLNNSPLDGTRLKISVSIYIYIFLFFFIFFIFNDNRFYNTEQYNTRQYNTLLTILLTYTNNNTIYHLRLVTYITYDTSVQY